VWLGLGLAACASQAATEGDGAVLRVLLPREVEQIDPRFTADAYGLRVSRLLFASLVTIDPHTLDAVPDLAQRVEVVSPIEYRAFLRPGLKFADGSVLDARDVKATFDSIRDPRVRSPYARTYARIVAIETPNAQQVVFRLQSPHATFLTDLEMPILRAEDARVRVEGREQSVVGAGPYRLLSRTTGRLVLAPNPQWHRGAPRHPHVELSVVRDDNTRALRLLAGAADLVINGVPPLLVPLFANHDTFQVKSARGIGTAYLGARTDRGPLADARVRQALSLLIDRDAIIKHKLGGRALPARGWITPGHWAFADDLPAPRFDPAAAARLLDEAGYPSRDGVRMQLVLRCGSDRFRQSLAHAIAAMARQAGVAIDVRPSEVATLIADLNRGHFDLGLLEVPEVIEPHVLSWFFGSDRIPDGRKVEGANRWRFRSAALDAALEEGRVQVDRARRVASYREVQRILAHDLPVIPLWHEDVVAVLGPRARDVAVPRDGRFSTLAW
jgi:peptide/nickel transport system substrate-binding protein